ncbi:MAG: N-acetylglucosaminyltransferase [Caeruleum heppii]|nr:MAG: N-acetylglucosaminyltransferase [Caeruleum heppii]
MLLRLSSLSSSLQEPFHYTRLGSPPGLPQTSLTKRLPSACDALSSKRVRAAVGGLLGALILFFFFVVTRAADLDLHALRSITRIPSRPPETIAGTDWTRFAYSQYVTSTAYLCNAVMIFEALHRFNSKADRVMMFPDDWPVFGDEAHADMAVNEMLLQKARDWYRVKLVPVRIQKLESDDSGSTTWADSFTKLLAFEQTQYDRVLGLDSDATLLQHMDELFLTPSAPIAMPRAYWLNPDDRTLSSQVVLLEPSIFQLDRILRKMESKAPNEYDMDIVNHLYRDNALVLPHRRYDLLSGEFKSADHSRYLGNDLEAWNGEKIINETHYVHFSDWPLPKPWIQPPEGMMEKKSPRCEMAVDRVVSCRDRALWSWLYHDFAARRKSICNMDLEPTPPGFEWDGQKKSKRDMDKPRDGRAP